MFDVLKGEGSLCFLEGPLGPSVFPNASTKLLYTYMNTYAATFQPPKSGKGIESQWIHTNLYSTHGE